MRHLLTLLLSAGAITASAQLINGSFENGSAGWTVPCDCAPAFFSSDVPIGTGAQCIGLENVHFDCPCMLFNAVHQFTPWITPGPWRLSGWIKSAVPNDIPGSRVGIAEGSPFSTPALGGFQSATGVWTFLADTFAIDAQVVLDSVRVFLVPDDGNDQPPTLCYFDDIQLTSLLNTGLHDQAPTTSAFRPNPAADQLWVDLGEEATGVVVVDATGRERALPRFHRDGRTLQVDVSSLTPGLCVMLLKTASGIRMVRFIKA